MLQQAVLRAVEFESLLFSGIGVLLESLMYLSMMKTGFFRTFVLITFYNTFKLRHD